MRHTNQRGFALAGAILALTVIAALIAGAFFAARQELNVGRSSQLYQRSFDAAEAGLSQTIAAWQSNLQTLNALAVGDSAGPFVLTLAGNTAYDTSWVTRLSNQMFLIRSTGRDQGNFSRRTLAALVRLQAVAMNVQAGLTTQGQLKIGGSSYIDGSDTPQSGWGCPVTGLDTLAGILIADSTQIQTSGCGNYSCISGDPKIQPDPTINDSTFFKFGDLDWNELVALATKTISPGTWNGIAPVGDATTCNTSVSSNWGEPGNPPPTFTVLGCVNYFPIIYVPGNLKVTGGRGQGILLVEGNLEVQGGFEFYGPVIVRGTLNTTGTGGHFNGGVLAANVSLDQSAVLGDAVITYSSCAITRALQYSLPGRLLHQRSWAEITQ
jgi:hypothetical protein